MRRSAVTLYYGMVDHAILEDGYSRLGLPTPQLTPRHKQTSTGYQERLNRIDSNNNPTVFSTVSNRIPCPTPFVGQKERMDRVAEAIAFRSISSIKAAERKLPAWVEQYVPETLGVSDAAKLTVNHIVFYDNRNGTIHAVVSKRNKKAIMFYDRYYINAPSMPWMRMTSGDRIRMMVKKNDHYCLIVDGEPVHWGSKKNMREWIDRPVEQRVPITANARMEVIAPTFVKRSFNRPDTLDLPRVQFILSMYSRIKS